MSLFARDDFGYLRQVEAFFLAHSQMGVMVSARDLELVRGWRRDGTPVDVVCRGIEHAFDILDDPPKSIHGTRKFVQSEADAWRQRSAGSHRADDAVTEPLHVPGRDLPDPNKPKARPRRASASTVATPWVAPWARSMDKLTELGQAAKDPRAKGAYRWAYRQMLVLKEDLMAATARALRSASVPLAVGEIEGAMYDHAFAELSDEQQRDLDGGMPDRMKQALGAMSDAAKGHQLRAWRRRAIQERLGVSPFFVP